MDGSHVLLYRAASRTEARLLAHALESAGIGEVIAGGDSPALRGSASFADALRAEIWVERTRAEQGRRVIEASHARGPGRAGPERRPWTCAGCREAVEAAFDLCWSCGAERPAERGS